MTCSGSPRSATYAWAARPPAMVLWSVTAIAPSPSSSARATRSATGVSQSGEWSVCMWKSHRIGGAGSGSGGGRRGRGVFE